MFQFRDLDDLIFRLRFRIVAEGHFRRSLSVMSEHEGIYPTATKEFAEQRKALAPKTAEAFKAFTQSVFAEGAVSAKTKQLIAVAVAHVTQCPYCIRGHTRSALQKGATPEEIMEAIWVAAEMRAGGAYAHSILALDTIADVQNKKREQP
jgi:AhpD family alkylhydroperoxidase